MKHYKIKLKTLSPIFIGSGNELQGNDYIVENDYKYYRLGIIDEVKLMEYLNLRRPLLKKFNDESVGIGDFIDDNKISHDKILKYKINSQIKIDRYKKKKFLEFIKNEDNDIYIPGSSIKGAIRTAIIFNEIISNKEKIIDYINKNNIDIFSNNKKDLLSIEDFAVKNIAERYNINENHRNNIFNYIMIGDSEPIKKNNKSQLHEKLFIARRKDCSRKAEHIHEMPTFLEFVNPNVDFIFDMTVNDDIDIFTKDKLETILKNYFNFQYNFFSKIFSDMIIKELQKSKNKERDRCIYIVYDKIRNYDPNIFIGGHSGYYTKNILYALLKNNSDDIGLNKENTMNMLKKHLDEKNNNEHNHVVYDNIITPRALRLTEYANQLYNIGICNLKIEKELC